MVVNLNLIRIWTAPAFTRSKITTVSEGTTIDARGSGGEETCIAGSKRMRGLIENERAWRVLDLG
ncbi:hypothetical protein TSUD_297630 [Trifolium subterraneum]|uniref:Uncharacterized protein n=1 Tax=Trifolium subterraneum TaxID=3900 RepID=A0A2Z6MDS5_TRISU|nr:hypothetical protein TSUD_297630 [Trifolium subterraneum]